MIGYAWIISINKNAQLYHFITFNPYLRVEQGLKPVMSINKINMFVGIMSRDK